MKLLIIHNIYQKNCVGGEDLVFKNEIEALRKRMGSDNVLSYSVSNDNIELTKLPYRIWFDQHHYKNIFKMIKKHHVNIVHVHNFYPMLTPSVFKAASDAGAKVIQTLHNFRWWCVAGTFYRDHFGICESCVKTNRKNFFNPVVHKCFRYSVFQSLISMLVFRYYHKKNYYNDIDAFFALTPFQYSKLIELGLSENKLFLKPNFISKGNPPPNNDQRNGYLFVGRLEESKGIFPLIRAWEKLDEKYQLTIVGSGPLEQYIRTKNLPNVNIILKLPNDEVRQLMRQFKYLIQASLWYETFGLTVIEAMSEGTPVIGFNIGTRKDFIVDASNGFLTTTENLDACIKKSFNYPGYNELSENAKKTSEAFTEDKIMSKQIHYYSAILSEFFI
ncbi:MAG: glycosyltransferase [Candidatus Magnetomorum sp.]|nr:glycosyltransferase [Candidatus Magnetomorum sp.]